MTILQGLVDRHDPFQQVVVTRVIVKNLNVKTNLSNMFGPPAKKKKSDNSKIII